MMSEEHANTDRRTFKSLDVYEELEVAVSGCFELLESLESFNTYYDFVLEDVEQRLLMIPASLADGYNRYHYKDKAEPYREARSEISRVQAELFVLARRGVLNRDAVIERCRELESSIGHLNGHTEDGTVGRRASVSMDNLKLFQKTYD